MQKTFTWSHVGVIIIGLLLVIAPFAISLPGKASAGQKMLNAFHPIMAPANVATAANYYNNDFVPLGQVATGGVAAAEEIPALIGALAKQLNMTQPQVETFLGSQFPGFGGLLSSFPQLVPVFQKIPAGLAAYKPLINTMQAQESNYAQVDSLPNFNLFTWFFVVPGVLLIVLGAIPLLARKRRAQPLETDHDGVVV